MEGFDINNPVYSLLYSVIRNHCMSINCEECEHYEHSSIITSRVIKGKFYCCYIYRCASPLDKLLLLIPNSKSVISVHPLWNVFMKHCNKHYIYGRFDCCKGCKFYNNNVCDFTDIWRHMNW